MRALAQSEVVALVAVDGVDGVEIVKAVGQSTHVGQEVVYSHRLDRRHGHGVFRRATLPHARFLQRVDPLADLVGEIEVALFVEHHHRDRGDGFGHRVDAPDGVVRDLEFLFPVPVSTLVAPDELATARPRRDPAGEMAIVHVTIEGWFDAREAARGEPKSRWVYFDLE